MSKDENKSFKPGDKVSWNSSGEVVHGTVVKRLTKPMDIKGHHVAASEDNPEYLVKSDASGEQAALSRARSEENERVLTILWAAKPLAVGAPLALVAIGSMLPS